MCHVSPCISCSCFSNKWLTRPCAAHFVPFPALVPSGLSTFVTGGSARTLPWYSQGLDAVDPDFDHEEPGYGYGCTYIRALVLWPMCVFPPTLSSQNMERAYRLDFITESRSYSLRHWCTCRTMWVEREDEDETLLVLVCILRLPFLAGFLSIPSAVRAWSIDM